MFGTTTMSSTVHIVKTTGWANNGRANLGFYKGGCPIHVKGALEVERQKFLYFLYQNGEFYALPEILIGIVTANRYERKLTLACFEHIFFQQRAPQSKRRESGHPGHPMDPPLNGCQPIRNQHSVVFLLTTLVVPGERSVWCLCLSLSEQ